MNKNEREEIKVLVAEWRVEVKGLEDDVVDYVLRRALKDPDTFLELYSLFLRSQADSVEEFIQWLRGFAKGLIDGLTKKEEYSWSVTP